MILEFHGPVELVPAAHSALLLRFAQVPRELASCILDQKVLSRRAKIFKFYVDVPLLLSGALSQVVALLALKSAPKRFFVLRHVELLHEFSLVLLLLPV